MLVEACLMVGDSKRALAALAEIEGAAADRLRDIAPADRHVHAMQRVRERGARSTCGRGPRPDDADALLTSHHRRSRLANLTRPRAHLMVRWHDGLTTGKRTILLATLRKQTPETQSRRRRCKAALARGRGGSESRHRGGLRARQGARRPRPASTRRSTTSLRRQPRRRQRHVLLRRDRRTRYVGHRSRV